MYTTAVFAVCTRVLCSRFLIYNVTMIWRLIKSLLRSIGKAFWHDPELQKVLSRYPRLKAWLYRRLTPDQKFGLHLTIGVLVTAVFVYFFFGIVQDLIGLDPLVQADLRIINLLQILRSPTWNSVMLFFTYLGKAEIVFSGLVLVVALLSLQRCWHYIVALCVSVLGGELFVVLIKKIIERPRPPLEHALLPESGYSFPSGHGFVALAFYGLVFYIWWRVSRGVVRRIFILLLGVLVIIGIGFSRIYLGVHWPSDVLASYASGAAWLTMIITALEINHAFYGRGEGKPRVSRRMAGVVATIFFLLWFGFVMFYFTQHPLADPQHQPEHFQALSDSSVPEGLFVSEPRYTESVSGKPIEPINIILIGSRAQLNTAFTRAQWDFSDQVSLGSLTHLVWALLFKQPYPQAPGTPTFWDVRANDFSLEQPTSANTVKERHHLHIWETPYRLVDGRMIWVGTAHFDTAIMLRSPVVIPTHVIDPAVDKERDKIKADLLVTGLVEKFEVYQIVEPTLGRNVSGGEFFTDGKAYVFWLK